MAEKKKVFLMDDDTVILNSLTKMLELSGFQVEATSDPKDVVDRIRSSMPNIILMDLRMPHLGGFELCEMLNNDEKMRDIPIIVLSGLADEADVKKAYCLGVIDYFTKPYDFQKLLQAINKVLVYKEGRQA